MLKLSLFKTHGRLQRALFAATLLLANTAVPFAQAQEKDEGSEWERKGEKYGVELYWRDYPNSSLPEFRAHTQIEASMASVLGILMDIEACTEWVHKCKQAFLVDQPEPNRQILYQVNNVPFANDRDMLMSAQLFFADQGNQVTIDITNAADYCQQRQAPNCAKIPDTDYVRIQHLSGQYRLRKLEDSLVEVVWQQHIELGGNLPGWIVRGKLDDLAYQSLRGLRRLAKKSAYQNLQIEIKDDELSVVETAE